MAVFFSVVSKMVSNIDMFQGIVSKLEIPVSWQHYYLPPSERRLFRCLPCHLSHRPRVMQTLRLRCAQSGLWGFTLTVRPAFGNLTNFSCAMVVVRRAGPCQNRDFPTGLWTLSRPLIRALECPLHIKAHSTRAIASSWAWSRCMSIQDICFAAGWSSQNTFARFYKLDVQSLASQVLSVSDWFMFAISIHVCCCLAQYYSAQPSMLLLSALYSVQLPVIHVWLTSCYHYHVMFYAA